MICSDTKRHLCVGLTSAGCRSVTPLPQLDRGENTTRDSWVESHEPCKPNTICHVKTKGGKRGAGKKKEEQKNHTHTPPPNICIKSGEDKDYSFDHLLCLVEGWGPGEDEQLKLLYANISSVVFLQSTPPDCRIALCQWLTRGEEDVSQR